MSPSSARITGRPTGWCRKSRWISTLDPERTVVRATLQVERNGDHDRPLRLAGDGLELLSVGRRRSGRWTATRWSSPSTATSATIETEVAIHPAANSKLMGLYASGGMLCTQCEAEGFRRITFFPDRPDVLSRYRVRMEADEARFPVLLANGNPVATGDGDDGTPLGRMGRPVPQALLSVRAGRRRPEAQPRQLHHHERPQGRPRHLGARGGPAARPQHAMESLKQAMAWDEKRLRPRI